jgi:hypothetical protein
MRETHLVQYEPPAADTLGSIDILIVKFDPQWVKAALIEADKFWTRVLAFYSDLGVPLGTELTPTQATKSIRNKKTIYLTRDDQNRLTQADNAEELEIITAQLSKEKSDLKIDNPRMAFRSKVPFGRRFSKKPVVATSCSVVEDDSWTLETSSSGAETESGSSSAGSLVSVSTDPTPAMADEIASSSSSLNSITGGAGLSMDCEFFLH